MKKILVLLISAIFVGSFLAHAYEPTGPLKVTGDRQLDESFEDLGYYASFDEAGFVSDLNSTYKVPVEKIAALIKEKYTTNAYFAVALSRLSGKPVDDLMREYDPRNGKGWKEIIDELGVKPGTKEFKILKKDTLVLLKRAKQRKSVAEEKKKAALNLLGVVEGSGKKD